MVVGLDPVVCRVDRAGRRPVRDAPVADQRPATAEDVRGDAGGVMAGAGDRVRLARRNGMGKWVVSTIDL